MTSPPCRETIWHCCPDVNILADPVWTGQIGFLPEWAKKNPSGASGTKGEAINVEYLV